MKDDCRMSRMYCATPWLIGLALIVVGLTACGKKEVRPAPQQPPVVIEEPAVVEPAPSLPPAETRPTPTPERPAARPPTKPKQAKPKRKQAPAAKKQRELPVDKVCWWIIPGILWNCEVIRPEGVDDGE